MQESNVTNKHFKRVLREVKEHFENDKNPPEDMFLEFLMELKYSNLLLPGMTENNELVTDIINADDTGTSALSLYTDDEEFAKDESINEIYDPLPYDLAFYIDFVNEDGLDGIVINNSTDCFFMNAEFLNNELLIDDISIENNPEAYGPHQLKDIAESVTNPSMTDYMADFSGDIYVEDLMIEMSNATFLDVIGSKEDFSNHEIDGIINLRDVVEWEPCTISLDYGDFAFLFTSKKAITDKMDFSSDFHYAYQVTVLSVLIEFVLRSDLDGIIINSVSDYFIIPRQALLIYSGKLDNPSLMNGIDYAFPL